MSRDDLIFDVNYSHRLEDMFGTLTGRIDKFISLLLFILGGTVLSPYANIFVFGLCVSVLSAIQLFYQFGKQSGISDDQAKKYLLLMSELSVLADGDLLKRFNDLQSSDSKPWGLLKNAAYKRTCIQLGLQDETPKLTWLETTAAWLAGDLPKTNGSLLHDKTPHP